MKEEPGLLRDVIGTARPEKENKGKKYLRIALTAILLSGFGLLIVAAVIRKFGS
jgi:hypothetical protein